MSVRVRVQDMKIYNLTYSNGDTMGKVMGSPNVFPPGSIKVHYTVRVNLAIRMLDKINNIITDHWKSR